jgi:hypothetical protein
MPADAFELFGIEDVLEGRRIGLLSAFDQFAAGIVNPAMQGIEEMFRAHEFGNPLIRAVVLEDCAQEPHLRLKVIRRLPEARAVIARITVARSISNVRDVVFVRV